MSAEFEIFVRRWVGEKVILREGNLTLAARVARREARLRRRKVYVRNRWSAVVAVFRPSRRRERADRSAAEAQSSPSVIVSRSQ
jgi:hypothetical protein